MENVNISLKDKIISAGGKVWAKESIERIYFNDREVIAKAFNFALVKSISGMIPADADGMILFGKTKSYFDTNNEIFCVDSGDIANALKSIGLSVTRI